MTKTTLAITVFVFAIIGLLLVKYFVNFMEWLKDLFE